MSLKSASISVPFDKLHFFHEGYFLMWAGVGQGPKSPGRMDAFEGKGPHKRPKTPLNGQLEEVAQAVGGGYCRSQMSLKLPLAVRETHGGGAYL